MAKQVFVHTRLSRAYLALARLSCLTSYNRIRGLAYYRYAKLDWKMALRLSYVSKKRFVKRESCAIAKITARISGSIESLRRYDHQKLSKMAASRQLGFDVTGNSAIRYADPENPTIEPNMKCIWSPVAEIWPFSYLWDIRNPILGEGEVVGGQRWHHSKERWWFPIGSPLWPLRYL